MENDAVNRIRIEAFKKHGGSIRIIRLRTSDNGMRYYVCQVKNGQIIDVIAGGTEERHILAQL